MKEIFQLLWTFVGAIVGVGVGLLAHFGLYSLSAQTYEACPIVFSISIFGLGGAGMLGGGYLALVLTTKIQKARRRQAREQKPKFGSKRRK